MHTKAYAMTTEELSKNIAAGLGEKPADLVIKGAYILDVLQGAFYTGDVAIAGKYIVGVSEKYSGNIEIDGTGLYVVPGFIDTHVHVESCLLTPERFQESVLPQGTTTAIWDPHEITNVWGTDALEWASSHAASLLMDILIMLPSCVPATHLETSGATLDAAALAKFKNNPVVHGLAEFMNVPGVLFRDPSVLAKLAEFSGMLRDGHAPLLSGKELNAYISAGINTCHECTGLAEAQEKLQKGMHVLIREGSCAKDAAELLPILNQVTASVVGLCSDDRNPLDVQTEGHISYIIELGLAKGIPPEVMFKSASYAGAMIHNLRDRGVIAPGYLADLVLIRPKKQGSWKQGFSIEAVLKKGCHVDEERLTHFAQNHPATVPQHRTKNINIRPLSKESFALKSTSQAPTCRVIEVIPRKLLTNSLSIPMRVSNTGEIEVDVAQDILKLAVVERHFASGNIGRGLVKGFNLQEGAIATSIGHDSHNITIVGCSNDAMLAAVEHLEKINGGIVVANGKGELLASLSLPIGGLMVAKSPKLVADDLAKLKHAAANLGCKLSEPFLHLSFLPLPVIPALKLTDKGLVDVQKFTFVEIEI